MVQPAVPLPPDSDRRPESMPPFDVSTEEAVLAALLLDEQAYARVVAILNPNDFFRDAHRWTYDAIENVLARGESVTELTIAHEIERAGHLADVGGEEWLFELTGKHFSATGVEAHARIVARDSAYRRLISVCGEIARLAYAGGPDADGVFATADALLATVRNAVSTGDFRTLSELLAVFLDDDTEDDRITAVRSGFMDLDALLGGFKRGDLVIVAARTGVGKSSLLLNFGRNAAVGQGGTVAFFALEMAAEQIAARLLATEAAVTASRLRMDGHGPDEDARIMHAITVLEGAPFHIDDSATLSVPEIRAKCRRLQADHGLDLVLVDYLQLLRGHTRPGDNRTAELSAITRSLKELARELDVPVVAAAQLSRAVETRTPHIPMLSDLRESGSIEQDADIVLFIYREDVYHTAESWEDDHPDQPGRRRPVGLAQLIVAKHRNGPTGTITVRFSDHLAAFTDIVMRDDPEA